VIDKLELKTIVPILLGNIDGGARVITDESSLYKNIRMHFRDHGFVSHQLGEYVSHSNPEIHTNTIEGFFSIFKRGMKGIYQHCGHNHLNRYLHEFDFRYNNRVAHGIDDIQRAENLLQGVKGKRLTYETVTI
jgi:ISXO2 transposase-like protein